MECQEDSSAHLAAWLFSDIFEYIWIYGWYICLEDSHKVLKTTYTVERRHLFQVANSQLPSKRPFQLGYGNRFCVVLLPNFDHADRLGRIAARVLLLICGTFLVILNLGSKRSPFPSINADPVGGTSQSFISCDFVVVLQCCCKWNQRVPIFHQLGSPRTSCVLLAGLQQRSGLFLEDLVWWQAHHRGRLEGNHIFSGRKPVELVAGYPATIWIIWHSNGKWSCFIGKSVNHLEVGKFHGYVKIRGYPMNSPSPSLYTVSVNWINGTINL